MTTALAVDVDARGTIREVAVLGGDGTVRLHLVVGPGSWPAVLAALDRVLTGRVWASGCREIQAALTDTTRPFPAAYDLLESMARRLEWGEVGPLRGARSPLDQARAVLAISTKS
ncbi:hypothetical protein GCM10027294_54060 [Marinactinospora endophytica]